MTNKTALLFSFLIIFIFSLGIFYFGINIAGDMKQGSATADDQFKEFIADIEFEKNQSEYLTQQYLDAVCRIIQKNPHIAAVTIKDETETRFAYPLASHYISTRNGFPEIFVQSSALKACSETLVNTEKPITVNAAVYLITPSKVFDYALFSFYIIAAGTFIALVLLAFAKKPAHKAAENAASAQSGGEMPAQGASAAQASPASKAEGKPAAPKTPYSAKQAQGKMAQSARTIDPLGLFSPATGLSWESYLETRLDAELVRAASSEQELALVYIRAIGIQHNHPCAKELSSILIDWFGFRDLLFEFGEDGYICILQNNDCNQTLMVCEKLYQELEGVIRAYGFGNQLVIGISTRTMRLISGIRLVKEAMEAVDKAIEDPELPIVAFRVNAERYRKFLAEELALATGRASVCV